MSNKPEGVKISFDWTPRRDGKESPFGALTFMLDDFHVRILRLEGKDAEADEYEAGRKVFWDEKMKLQQKSKWWRWRR